MKSVKGDLLSLAAGGTFDVLVHGCNCFNTMGAGIAKTIRDRFPAAYDADLKTVSGDREKLGTITTATIQSDDHEFVIVNAYTQYDYRGSKNADYEAIRSAFKVIRNDFKGQRIGYPLLGAGLAGGDWEVISKIIDEELAGEDHTVVIFQPE